MADNLDEILALVGGVNELLARSPRGAEIFDRIRSQKISVDEGVKELLMLSRDQSLIPELQKASQSLSALIPGVTSELNSHPLMMKTSTGIPQLNPLYEAALAERASIDGDVPELRYGPLPHGAHPAVPVLTDSLDPIAVGLMLKRASEEVAQELDVKMTEHAQIQDMIQTAAIKVASESGTSIALASQAAQALMPLAPTGVPGYRAGEMPVLRQVQLPTPIELASLDPVERRLCSFRAIATTQGRVSLTRPIQNMLLEALTKKGFKVELSTPTPSSSVSTVWSVSVWGAEDLVDNFNYALVAVKALTLDLLTKIEGAPHLKGKELALEVSPYNGIADRQFGWVARMGFREGS